jgi:hypothetical protein
MRCSFNSLGGHTLYTALVFTTTYSPIDSVEPVSIVNADED